MDDPLNNLLQYNPDEHNQSIFNSRFVITKAIQFYNSEINFCRIKTVRSFQHSSDCGRASRHLVADPLAPLAGQRLPGHDPSRRT
jgi:hypothetical protein